MTDPVKVEIDASVMTLTLARPEKKNALSNAMYRVLADSLEAAEQDPDGGSNIWYRAATLLVSHWLI